jgi:hypothetical protein
MSNIVAQSSHSQHTSPVCPLVVRFQLGDKFADRVTQIAGRRHNVKDSPGKLHNPQRMLEALMGCAGIHERSQGKLVNVAESLERTRVNNSPLLAVEANKCMDRIAKLVPVFHVNRNLAH